jgi:hypothetical protein
METRGPTTIEKSELPIPNNTMGLGDVAIGGGVDNYALDKEPNYSLPFSVWGFVDLRGCEHFDEPGETASSLKDDLDALLP